MLSIAGWMTSLTIAVCATILTAAIGQPALHMAAAGIVSTSIAILAIREHRLLTAAAASPSTLASSTARYLGLVWAWGALAILVTYLFIFANGWPEWWQFCLGFVVAAGTSIAFSNMLADEANPPHKDDPMIKFGRVLIIVQLIGVAAGVISMFVDGKFPRAATHPDWAGCNIFFFGALAIAAISLDALRKPATA